MLVARATVASNALPDGLLDDADWSTTLQQARQVPVVKDEVFARVERMFLTGVVGVIESTTPEQSKRNSEAVEQRATLHSSSFKRHIDLTHFDDFRNRFDAAWSLDQFRRYFDQMLFRKFLGLHRPLISNAAALYLTLPLLEWYRDLSAYAAGKLQPDVQDVRNAFDVVEFGLIQHARHMNPFFSSLAQTHQKLLP